MSKPKKVLFICTGNYYRSRYAEAVFNHHARRRNLLWEAFSRGTAPYGNRDDKLSPHTEGEMRAKGIAPDCTAPQPVELTELDLETADYVVALNEKEHKPMIAHLFPGWSAHIHYWNISDLDESLPSDTLPRIETHVLQLLDTLEKQGAA